MENEESARPRVRHGRIFLSGEGLEAITVCMIVGEAFPGAGDSELRAFSLVRSA